MKLLSYLYIELLSLGILSVAKFVIGLVALYAISMIKFPLEPSIECTGNGLLLVRQSINRVQTARIKMISFPSVVSEPRWAKS